MVKIGRTKSLQIGDLCNVITYYVGAESYNIILCTLHLYYNNDLAM